MALKLFNSRLLSVRHFATEPNPFLGIPNLNYEATILPNKLLVASVDIKAPISRVCIAYRVGSRDEPIENLGISHVMRVAAGSSTKGSSSFGITRNLQQVGQNLYVTNDRENFQYVLEGTCEDIEKGMPYLGHVASSPAFKPWEVTDLVPRLNIELQARTDSIKVMENLHKVAFRYGLGNSIYLPKYFIKDLDSETLMHFFYNNFTPSRTIVVGSGIDHKNLISFAQSLSIEEPIDKCERVASKYSSGEIRFDKGGDMATFAIATQGASIKNRKEFFTYGILSEILGKGSHVKWCNEAKNVIAKFVEPHPQLAISAFNIGYSDNGLIGVLVTCPSDKARYVAEGVFKALHVEKLDPKDFQRGKNQYIASVMFDLENALNQMDDSVVQLLNTGWYKNPEETLKEIESITLSDVNNIATKISLNQFSISAYGRIHNVPFLDEFV